MHLVFSHFLVDIIDMKFLTVKKTALELAISTGTLRKWIKMGAPHILLNPDAVGYARRVRCTPEEVAAWAKEKFGTKNAK